MLILPPIRWPGDHGWTVTVQDGHRCGGPIDPPVISSPKWWQPQDFRPAGIRQWTGHGEEGLVRELRGQQVVNPFEGQPCRRQRGRHALEGACRGHRLQVGGDGWNVQFLSHVPSGEGKRRVQEHIRALRGLQRGSKDVLHDRPEIFCQPAIDTHRIDTQVGDRLREQHFFWVALHRREIQPMMADKSFEDAVCSDANLVSGRLQTFAESYKRLHITARTESVDGDSHVSHPPSILVNQTQTLASCRIRSEKRRLYGRNTGAMSRSSHTGGAPSALFW